MQLPIDVVPGSKPPIFRWRHMVDTPAGKKIIEYQDALPVTVEKAVETLIGVAKQLAYENAALQGRIDGMVERAEAEAQAVARPSGQQHVKKGK